MTQEVKAACLDVDGPSAQTNVVFCMGRVKVSARASNTIQSAPPPSTTFFLRYSRARD